MFRSLESAVWWVLLLAFTGRYDGFTACLLESQYVSQPLDIEMVFYRIFGTKIAIHCLLSSQRPHC